MKLLVSVYIVRIRSAGIGIPKAMQPRLGFIFLYYKQQN